MRIISNFKDYYDCIQGYGFDPKIVYMRETKNIELDRDYHAYDTSKFIKLRYDVVGFCEKSYPLIRLKYIGDLEDKWYHCYFIEDVDVFAERFLDKQDLAKYYDSKSVPHYQRYPLSRSSCVQFFSEGKTWRYDQKDVRTRYQPLFEKYKTPIFWRTFNSIVINPMLKDLEFYRIKDAYTAYQDLSHYVGNVLIQPTIEASPISDKDMASIKGFDKFSFRKDKS